MIRYTARFSNGITIERSSEHDYKTAGGYINIETGELVGVVFSGSVPKENRPAVYIPINRRIEAAMGRRYIEQAKAHNAQMAKVWKWEVVKVERQ